MDPTRSLQDADDASLANFFSRPVKIEEREWSTSIQQNFSINPWTLFFKNPRVSNKLNNFYLLKAKLKVKVVINGNGFHYGRMMVNYLPLDGFDSFYTNAFDVKEDFVQASQLPHIFLNPTNSTGGELSLPMFYHKNYMNITTGDWIDMGRLYFRTLNPLKHANGASDKVTITVFAWAEDVSMSVLTSVDALGLDPQSGEIDEANAKGVISGPATAIAKFAAYLKGVPYIAPFATATEIGANAAASMAKIFGYSRPSITKAPETIKSGFSSLALTTVPDNVQKLTVDDKQELTIDPRIAGIGPADPLNIREIAKRESYLTTFSWPMDTAPDQLLWNSRVTPVTWAESGTNNPATGDHIAYHFPACAFAALPFQYWKGTMKYRFQIVCSSFHKGRLRITYDPYYMTNTSYLGFSEYNINYLKVVDISEEQDFTIEVGNAQPYSFLPHANPGRVQFPNYNVLEQVYSNNLRLQGFAPGNGTISVHIVNELTTPNSVVNNNIEINVYVSAGDDFEVAGPNDYFSQFVTRPLPAPPVENPAPLVPQSGAIVSESQDTQELDAPQQSISTVVGLPPVDNPNLNKIFMGESITSFRTMLKRYMLWNTIPKANVIGNTDSVAVSGRFNAFPYYRGAVSGAVNTFVANEVGDLQEYNFCNTILLHWVRLAFAGSRGSIRYKLIPRGYYFGGDTVQISRVPLETGPAYYRDYISPMPEYLSPAEACRSVIPEWETDNFAPPRDTTVTTVGKPFPSFRGIAALLNTITHCLEFEVPYYSRARFTPGKRQDLTTNMVNEAAWDYFIQFNRSNTNSNSACYDIYVAAGEDFQTYFYTGLPRMYFEKNPPTAGPF